MREPCLGASPETSKPSERAMACWLSGDKHRQRYELVRFAGFRGVFGVGACASWATSFEANFDAQPYANAFS